MAKQHTDNDSKGFSYKVSLRLDSIADGTKFSVLDTFHGHGMVWGEVAKNFPGRLNVTGIDTRSDKTEVFMKGDNEKYLLGMDVNTFDIIDVDAYGSPFKILEILFKQNYTGIVHATFIQSLMGGLNHDLLIKLGYTVEMIKKCPTLFSKNGFDKFCEYLALNGVDQVNYLDIGRKFYFWFKRK